MISVERAAKAAGAEVRNAGRFPAELRIVTDTRTLVAGDTFLALRGDRFDGHAYVTQALERGAAAVIVDRADSLPASVPALIVADTKRAYLEMAGAARALYRGRVIAITGSSGKTTVKHLLAQLLAAHYGSDAVLATPANENNEIGVSRLLLNATDAHRVLVVEMGARHAGEIAELASIARPHVGILTNIGEAHLEVFGSRERLAETKWGLFASGAQAVLNARDPQSALRASALATPPMWFGAGEPGAPGVWIEDARSLVLTYGAAPQRFPIDARLPGAHNRANLAAALAAALLLGIPAEESIAAIPRLTLPQGRYEVIRIPDAPRIIYDAYNANASGTVAALDAFAAEPEARRIAVLASMAELGEEAPAMHERIGAHAAATGVSTILAGGDFAECIAAGALATGYRPEDIVRFAGNEQAAQWLREHAGPGDVVLLKGSRKYRMEEIVDALRALCAPA